jgi:hypothetical protein
MKTFENTILDVPASGFWWGGRVDYSGLSKKLNEMGRKGWEVVARVKLTCGRERREVYLLF